VAPAGYGVILEAMDSIVDLIGGFLTGALATFVIEEVRWRRRRWNPELFELVASYLEKAALLEELMTTMYVQGHGTGPAGVTHGIETTELQKLRDRIQAVAPNDLTTAVDRVFELVTDYRYERTREQFFDVQRVEIEKAIEGVRAVLQKRLRG
jgi:hypothetical protein